MSSQSLTSAPELLDSKVSDLLQKPVTTATNCYSLIDDLIEGFSGLAILYPRNKGGSPGADIFDKVYKTLLNLKGALSSAKYWTTHCRQNAEKMPLPKLREHFRLITAKTESFESASKELLKSFQDCVTTFRTASVGADDVYGVEGERVFSDGLHPAEPEGQSLRHTFPADSSVVLGVGDEHDRRSPIIPELSQQSTETSLILPRCEHQEKRAEMVEEFCSRLSKLCTHTATLHEQASAVHSILRKYSAGVEEGETSSEAPNLVLIQ